MYDHFFGSVVLLSSEKPGHFDVYFWIGKQNKPVFF